ncbi:prephenate dehydratase domain-containing protein [Streptomyces sp. NPDC004542]|uniref:prephenate dehydratase domain-containing protein n=1 Tax=Streptomyces sp. NPDC004542 TaxID=3154281 RepID=UPI0033B272EE
MSATEARRGRDPEPGGFGRPARRWRFSYLGPEGTFTERALGLVPEAGGAELLPAATAAQALARVDAGLADAAMLPIHNTVAGTVPETAGALVGSPAPVVLKEVVLEVEFALLVRPGTAPAQIRTVTGHRHAMAQVRGWLNRHLPWARWVPAPSNAEGARGVRDGRCDAAVAGEFTAARYGLEAAATAIHDAPGATTRFLLCARRGTPRVPGSAPGGRTSLIGRFPGRPDQFEARLDELRGHPFLSEVGLDVVPHGEDGAVLFADCPGGTDRPATARAVGLLQLRLPGLRSLGSYESLRPGKRLSERRSTTMHSENLGERHVPGVSTAEDIGRLREQIDTLDDTVIVMLRERLAASREIQRLRTGSGGGKTDPGREHAIRGRFEERLGDGGSAVADAVLVLCRGQALA